MTEESLRRGERTRTEILQAAHDLFAEQGYHGTSMRQIAEKAETALGGLYNHFGSKADVFRHVILTYHPYREVMPAIIDAPGETVEEFLANATRILMDQLIDRPDFLNLILIEIVEFDSAHVAEVFRQVLPLALQIIDKINRLDKGSLRQIEPLLLMRIFISLFLGLYLTEIGFARQLPAEFSQGAVDKYIDVFLHGIVTTPG